MGQEVGLVNGRNRVNSVMNCQRGWIAFSEKKIMREMILKFWSLKFQLFLCGLMLAALHLQSHAQQTIVFGTSKNGWVSGSPASLCQLNVDETKARLAAYGDLVCGGEVISCPSVAEMAYLQNRGSSSASTAYVYSGTWLNRPSNPAVYGQCTTVSAATIFNPRCEGWGQTGYSVHYSVASLQDNGTCICPTKNGRGDNLAWDDNLKLCIPKIDVISPKIIDPPICKPSRRLSA